MYHLDRSSDYIPELHKKTFQEDPQPVPVKSVSQRSPGSLPLFVMCLVALVLGWLIL